jgi:hypothetical protein
MKKKIILLSAFATLFFLGCNIGKTKEVELTGNEIPQNEWSYYGDTINVNGAQPSDKLLNLLNGKDSVAVKLSSKIDAVCQKKGCWMNLVLNDSITMQVRFKDYSFFVPKDAAGKEVCVDGFAFADTISVEDQKHYAEDAGKTKEEIAQIVRPEITISFEARGVAIKK